MYESKYIRVAIWPITYFAFFGTEKKNSFTFKKGIHMHQFSAVLPDWANCLLLAVF
jgi:hypothetical protein